MSKGTLRALGIAGALVLAATLTGAPAAEPPANDDFGSAVAVGALPFLHEVNTDGATTEAGEPDAMTSCAAAGGSVWYRYTPSESLQLAASTSGSSFDAFIGVYTGASVTSLSLLGCAKSPFFDTTAGTTYYFQIGGTDVDVLGNFIPETGDAVFRLDLFAPVPPPCPECPTFSLHRDPFGYRAGEVSIGVTKTDATLFLELTKTLKVTFDDQGSETVATWKNVSGLLTGRSTNDPILWTDPTTGRTFVVQLYAPAGSIIEYTDDDGATWQATEPGIAAPSWDHQTLGTAPYPAPLVNPIYPNAVYYCAQSGTSLSQCTRSDDGGLTFGPAMPMNVLACGGLHGHIAGAPDGTVVVPHKSCDGEQGIISSTDLGTTWSLRTVPGTVAARSDPQVAFDAAGKMYFAASSDGKPVVAVSRDNGKTFSEPFDVGAAFGIRNTEFPMIVAGDAGRAAFAFYGTPGEGNDQLDTFTAPWHVYVAYTYDGGETWQTMNVTPGDPVQRGCIWLAGGSNPCRNLLDFQGMTIDSHGRVLVGIADGCVDACVGLGGTPVDSRASIGYIARQSSGKGLIAEYDGTL